jgi:hypothetical protein
MPASKRKVRTLLVTATIGLGATVLLSHSVLTYMLWWTSLTPPGGMSFYPHEPSLDQRSQSMGKVTSTGDLSVLKREGSESPKEWSLVGKNEAGPTSP